MKLQKWAFLRWNLRGKTSSEWCLTQHTSLAPMLVHSFAVLRGKGSTIGCISASEKHGTCTSRARPTHVLARDVRGDVRGRAWTCVLGDGRAPFIRWWRSLDHQILFGSVNMHWNMMCTDLRPPHSNISGCNLYSKKPYIREKTYLQVQVEAAVSCCFQKKHRHWVRCAYFIDSYAQIYSRMLQYAFSWRTSQPAWDVRFRFSTNFRKSILHIFF